MRQIYIILVSLFFSQNLMQAQVFNHVIATGFNTIGYELKPLGNGRWLAVGIGNEIPGRLFTDSIVAVVFNNEGTKPYRHTLQLPPSEAYGIRAATGIANGGYAIAIVNFSCDAVTDFGTLQVFDYAGTLIWSKSSAGTQWRVPDRLLSTPDGHLFAIFSEKIIKYDLQTGDMLFEADLKFAPNPYVNIRDIAFYPGTENLVGIGYPSLQFWEKTGTPDAPVYQLTGLNIQPYVSLSNLVQGPPGQFFTMESNTGRVFEFSVPNLTYTEIIDLPSKVYGLAANGQRLILCSQIDGISHLITTDFSGKITDSIPVSDHWQLAYRMALQDSTLALLGYGGSGPSTLPQGWYPYNSVQLWFQTRSLPPFDQTEMLPDAALTAIIQASALKIVLLSGQWRTFNGGQFSVQVTNSGNTTLHSVDVLIGFDKVNGICEYRSVERRHFTGLSLEPGESAWLDFGDISGTVQNAAPWQFCFWTTQPNEKPDANHDNDVYCHDVSVNTTESHQNPVQIYPNPAESGFWVQTPSDAPCNLFDVSGRLIQAVHVPAVDQPVFIPVGNLPNGLYFLRQGTFVEKIMVQHDR